MVTKETHDEPGIDGVFPSTVFSGKTADERSFNRAELLKLVNNSIDASTFGNNSSQDAVKLTFERNLRDAMEKRGAKPGADATAGDYLQVFARIGALASESYNHELHEQFMLQGKLLSLLAAIGHEYMDITDRDFAEAKLNPQDYNRFVSVKEHGIPSVLGRNLPPSSGAAQRYTWAVLPPQFWRPENQELIATLTKYTEVVAEVRHQYPPHLAQPYPLTQNNLEENSMPQAELKKDVEPIIVPYTDTIGYQIMTHRAARNLTEEQLAERLNEKVQVDTVNKEHVVNWQENKELHMLVEDKALYAALKHVLVEENKSLKDNPEQQERVLKRFDDLLEEAIEHKNLSPAEQEIFRPAFGSVLTSLRNRAGLSEEDLAIMVNLQKSEVANLNTPSISKQDVIDFQAGTKLPDERVQVRLASVLGLDFSQAAELRKKAVMAKGELTAGNATEAELNEKFRTEVFEPMKKIYEDNKIRGRRGSFTQEHNYMYHPFAKGGGTFGRENNPQLAEDVMNGRIEKVTKPMRDAGVDEALYGPLIRKWREMQKEYSQSLAQGQKAEIG